jgi:hypothetical protein
MSVYQTRTQIIYGLAFWKVMSLIHHLRRSSPWSHPPQTRAKPPSRIRARATPPTPSASFPSVLKKMRTEASINATKMHDLVIKVSSGVTMAPSSPPTPPSSKRPAAGEPASPWRRPFVDWGPQSRGFVQGTQLLRVAGRYARAKRRLHDMVASLAP